MIKRRCLRAHILMVSSWLWIDMIILLLLGHSGSTTSRTDAFTTIPQPLPLSMFRDSKTIRVQSKQIQTTLYSSSHRDTDLLWTSTTHNSSSASSSSKSLSSWTDNHTSSCSSEEMEWIQKNTATIKNGMFSVISAALLITSNTVGAGMMTLPSLAAGPGLMATSLLMLMTYIINLISGLLIAEVSINQCDSIRSANASKNGIISRSSRTDMPSSFKELTDLSMNDFQIFGTWVGVLSLFINSCVLTFDLSKAAEMISSMTGISNLLGLIGTTLTLIVLVGTQRTQMISSIASVLCMILFTSFAGLILPGLASIMRSQDPMGIFYANPPGGSTFGTDQFYSDLSTLFPVLLTTMVYQNIVPTVTKILDYDRAKVVTAITIGSLIPMLMYIMFCYTVLGNQDIGMSMMSMGPMGEENAFLSGIAISSVMGSSMSCVMSIGEEVKVFFDKVFLSKDSSLSKKDNDGDKSVTEGIPLLYVFYGSLPAFAIAFSSGKEEGLVGALSISGTYGTPLLYFLIPVILAFSQRTGVLVEMERCTSVLDKIKLIGEKMGQNKEEELHDTTKQQLVPGGFIPLGGLAGGTWSLLATSFVHDVAGYISMLSRIQI